MPFPPVTKQATAAEDLRRKLELEDNLRRDLREYDDARVREFIRSYARGGAAPSLFGQDAPLADLLAKHYQRTSDAFRGSVNDHLPSELRLTPDEATAITAALAAYFASRADEQARLINETTAQEQATVVTRAREDEPELSPQEIAVVAGAALARSFRAREASIAITETQAAAEATKATEAEVLSGVEPTISGGTPRAAGPLKTWDSVGDSHVRPAHLDADGQTVPVNEPFAVGGERLMFPGDTSRGASADNVIGCRCGASYDTEAIAEQRRGRTSG